MKRALITGITGQDGSYLAELLLKKGYQVFGLNRRTSMVNYDRISHIIDRIELIPGDLLDQFSLISAVRQAQPDEVYNLAAQSFVATSWGQPKVNFQQLIEMMVDADLKLCQREIANGHGGKVVR